MFTNIDVKFLLIFKFADHRTKERFVSPASKALVGTLITKGDVIDMFVILKCLHEGAYCRALAWIPLGTVHSQSDAEISSNIIIYIDNYCNH